MNPALWRFEVVEEERTVVGDLYPECEEEQSESLEKAGSSLHYVRSGTGSPKMLYDMITCGTDKWVKVCPVHKDHKIWIVHNCGRLQCSVCMHSKVVRLAREADERFQQACKMYANRMNLRLRDWSLKHVEFSVHPSLYILEDFEKDGGKFFFEKLDKLFKKKFKIEKGGKKASVQFFKNGFYAGCLILHLERKKHVDDGTPCKSHRCKRDHHWVWGPHFHWLGYGFMHDSVQVEDETDWVYKIIPDDQSYDDDDVKEEDLERFGPRSVFGTVFYQLTHCALFVDEDGRQRNQSLRWLGKFSKYNVRRKRVRMHDDGSDCYDEDCKEHHKPRTVDELCGVCHAVLHRYGITDSEDGVNWNYDQGEACRRVDKFAWYLHIKTTRRKRGVDESGLCS